VAQSQLQVHSRTFDPEAILRRAVYVVGGLTLLLLLAAVVYPSLVLVRNSFSTQAGVLTLQNYLILWQSSSLGKALSNSLVVSILATIGATLLGVLLAWLMARTDVPMARLWRSLLIVPYLIPPFIGAIAWVYLLGPVGYLNQAYMALTGSDQPFFIIYGQAGIVLVMILYSYPIAYMVNLAAFERTNPALEEAARISGATLWHALKDVALPLALPSIGGSAVLIFLSLMANFGIPAVLGFTVRYFVLTTEIYNSVLNFSQANNLQVAAAESMLLVVLAVVAMEIQRHVQRRNQYAVVSGQSVSRQISELRRLKLPVVILLSMLIVLSIVAPLVAIFLTAVSRAPGVTLTPENMTMRNFTQLLFEVPKVQRAMLNSLGLAAGSATLIMVLSVIIAFISVRLRWRIAQPMDALAALPYAVPGTAVALAMILAYSQPVMGVVLYNTIWILLFAYVMRFLTLGVRTVSAAFEQIHESLEEAARISGADAVQALTDIAIPLIRSSIFAGWFLVFVPALTELTLSVLLVSVNNETMGSVVYGLNTEGKANQTAAMALILSVLVLIIAPLAQRIAGREIQV
jgi:iron(III) transport system permease protein